MIRQLGTRRWLWWHTRHGGQPVLRLANAQPITVTTSATATVHAVAAGGEPGAVVAGVLQLGTVQLFPQYVCTCGKTRYR